MKQIVVEEGKEDKAGAMKTREYKQKLYAITRNTNKRIRRRRDQIKSSKTTTYFSKKKNITAYQKQELKLSANRTECHLSKLKAEVGRINHRASYWKSSNSTKINELRTEVKKLKEEVSSLEFNNVK